MRDILPARNGLLVFSLVGASFCCADSDTPPIDSASELHHWVDPFIGTGGNPLVCGHNSPAATTPFGLVRLAPDTVSSSGATATNTSGYYYGHSHILGFSHTRLCGTGAVDGGHIRVIPTGLETPLKKLRRGMQGRLDHDRELASPGYYAIELPDHRVRVELTATSRVGVHRYHFAAGVRPRIVIDVGSTLGKGRSEDCHIDLMLEDREVTGFATTFGSFSGRYGGLKVYFAAKLSHPWQSSAIWADDRLLNEATQANGDDVGAELSFPIAAAETPLVLTVAISHVSIDNARENLNQEAGSRSFESIHQAAAERWSELLSRVEIEGGTDDERRIFYTALFRSLTMPTTFNDFNGEYLGFDNQVHLAEGFQYYTDMSLWDTFRTTHPLFTLLVPDRHRDMLVSLVKMAEQGGGLPRWPAGAGYSGSMFGAPAEIAITEAYLKGIRNFDVEKAYKAMRTAALAPPPPGSRCPGRRDIADYIQYGYCPSDKTSAAVAKTLEYASSDAAIGRLAAALGQADDAKRFGRRAQFYRNVWNPETRYFQPRDSAGKFSTPLQPLLLTYLDFRGEITDDYVEGSALQWRWSVGHDAAGLVSLFPSKADFANELDAFFAGAGAAVGRLPNGYYWHGNQPDIHAAYLFNAADRPDLTQKWVRWILQRKYGVGPGGLDGNDDGGTLSAWYVLSSLGFYPIVGTDRYQLGSPLWKRAVIQIGPQPLEIVAEKNGPESSYVARAELNGKQLDRTWITHDEIAGGGTLRFVMSQAPGRP